jgi:anti-anti-sigma regulatory factor
MASNFQIFTFKTKDSLHLKLSGDFDGSSAYELTNTLKSFRTDFHEIFVDTNDLKIVHSFGNEVLQKNLNAIKKQLKNLIFVGTNKHKIAPN